MQTKEVEKRKICKEKELKKQLSLQIEDTRTRNKGIQFISNK
jgi:hypothetical protein